MKRRFSVSAYIILALIAIGLLAKIISSPSSYIIPIVVFGIIFALYKFPPKRYDRGGANQSSYSYQGKPREKKKPTPFRVIQGNKNPSDDDTPKFH
ncbi:MAG: hypothetical protein JWM44_4279 [Bacilli bacterium]|nr:hypothetical protein [Bacilli bacterium]